VAANLQLSQGAPNYTRTVKAIQAATADVVYYTGYYADANKLITDLKSARYTGQIVVADGCIDNALFTGLTEAQAEGVYGTSLPMPEFQPGAEEWSARYKDAVGSAPGANTLEAYDSVRVALDAIRRAGTSDRAAVRSAIAATSDLRVISGPVRFNPDGTRANAGFLLLKAHKRAFRLAPASTNPTT
jgi:branched-chain amino acid transport system substrate-binding protein